MLLKIRNHGNSFRTITAGELPKGGEATVQEWEARMWLKDATKQIEIVEEPKAEEKPKAKRKKK